MFLKYLEIQGFKSFPDKVKIEFNKGITGIVGPNGSGKSNISDAIRWVMGEQSIKSLRGGKMEDVIFAGTQERDPVGFAEVSICFDNSEKLFNVARLFPFPPDGREKARILQRHHDGYGQRVNAYLGRGNFR